MTSTINNITTPTTSHCSIEQFCEMTQKAYAAYAVDVDVVLNSHDGWTALANLWEELIYETGKDLFADALHLIKWGFPICINEQQAYQDLILAVCEAILSNTPAYHAWIKHYFFRCCVQGITKDNVDYHWHPGTSKEHFRFLTAQTIVRLWRYAHGHKAVCNDATLYVDRYKARIMRIIPQSCHWNYDQWRDESNIFREILRLYNLDFSCNLTAYSILHQLLDAPTAVPKKIDTPAVDSLIYLDLCSPELITAIWPLSNANIIIKLFLLAEKTACYWFDLLSDEVCDEDGWRPTDSRYTYLRQSWLFAYVRQELYSNKIPARYTSKVKRAVLNIELRSNCWKSTGGR